MPRGWKLVAVCAALLCLSSAVPEPSAASGGGQDVAVDDCEQSVASGILGTYLALLGRTTDSSDCAVWGLSPAARRSGTTSAKADVLAQVDAWCDQYTASCQVGETCGSAPGALFATPSFQVVVRTVKDKNGVPTGQYACWLVTEVALSGAVACRCEGPAL